MLKTQTLILEQLHFRFSGASYKIHFPQVWIVLDFSKLLTFLLLTRTSMSMSGTQILTHEQRNMLKPFLPGFKLVHSGSVEEQDMFWENVFTQWFTAWPERAVHYPGVPLEQELSDLQQALLKFAIQHLITYIDSMMTQRIKTFIYANTLQRDAPDIIHIERLFPSQETDKTVSMKRWRHIFVDVEVRNIVLDGVGFLSAMPWKWTTSEQEEFLTSMFAEYLEHTMGKRYEEFSKKVNKLFFERRPEQRALFGDLPTDYVLTPDQAKYLVTAVETREQQIATWYWCGVKGVLKFDTVLAGGVELKGTRGPHKMDIYSYEYYLDKVKDTADTKIRVQDVTNRGPKLNKHHEVTHHMYAEESEEVKHRIERKYQKARAKHAKARLHLKTGRLPQIDNKVKIKAICELGPMLDQILKYLAYAMGGWKFSILMGGNDPSTGEVSVFNYHVGELESGAQFDQTYANFEAVQAAFLTFVKDALAFESILPQDLDVEEEEDSSSDSDDDSDEERVMSGDDLLPNITHPISTSGMYRMILQSESSVENLGNAYAPLSRDASLTPGLQLPSDSHFN
ncbi:hypothetical protein F4604DRAFT_1686242 [Suillus subluteus]|nr:hypothetical protein F4604DRAFT_1686242 [Suillus subluteus]